MLNLHFRTAALVLCCLVSASVGSICGSSDLQNARCYLTDKERVGDTLLTVGQFTPPAFSGTCTGFIINQQFFITTHQCAEGDKAATLTVNFQAFQDSTDCSATERVGDSSYKNTPRTFTAERLCQSYSADFSVYKLASVATFTGVSYAGTYYGNLNFPTDTTKTGSGTSIYIPQFQNDVGMQIAINEDTSSGTCTIIESNANSCISGSVTNFGHVCDVIEDASESANFGGAPIIATGTTTVLGMHHCNSANRDVCSFDSKISSSTALDFSKIAIDFSSCMAGCADTALDGLTACVTTGKKRQTSVRDISQRLAPVWTRPPVGFISPNAAQCCTFNFANMRTLDSTIYNLRVTGHYIYARTTDTANQETVCAKTNSLSRGVIQLLGSSLIDGDDFAISGCCGTVTGFSANNVDFGPKFFLDAFQLFENGDVFRSTTGGTYTNQVAHFSNAPGNNGFVTERAIFLDKAALEGYSVLTFLDTFTNNNALSISKSIVIDALLVNNVVIGGEDFGTLTLVEAFGGFPVSEDSEWLLYSTPQGRGSVGILTHGPGAQKPIAIDLETMCSRGDYENGVKYTWDINLSPGQSVTLMYFAVVDTAVEGGDGIVQSLAEKVAAGSVAAWSHVKQNNLNVINFQAPSQTPPTLMTSEFDCGPNVPELDGSFDMGPAIIRGGDMQVDRQVTWTGLNRIGTFSGAQFSLGQFGIPKFSGGFRLLVGGVRYIASAAMPTISNNGPLQIRTFPAVRMRGLDVSRRIVLNTGPASSWLRYTEIFSNPSSTSITVLVTIATTVSKNELVVETSSGNDRLGMNDAWIVTSQDFFSSFPFTGWTFRGSTGPQPVRAQFSSVCGGPGTLREMVISFRVTVPPGERRAIIHFADPRLTKTMAAQDASATALMDITASPDQLRGMEDFASAEIFNFAAPVSAKRSLDEQNSVHVPADHMIKPVRPYINIKDTNQKRTVKPVLEQDDVEIQVGYVSAGYGFTRTVAVAMQVGDIVVSVRETDDDPPRLQIMYDDVEYRQGQPTPGARITVAREEYGRVFITLAFANERGMKIDAVPGVYLNFCPKLTSFDVRNIEGLIGFWNNDPSDDLRSSDRVITDATDQLGILQFANSWLLQGDDFNLFTLDDFTTDEFFDPNHMPSHGGLADLKQKVDPQLVQEAIQACEQLGVEFLERYTGGQYTLIIPEPNVANTQSYKDACVRDFILAGNDRVLEAEPYGSPCTTNCNGNGRCLENGTCICAEGYSGPLCDVATGCPRDDEGNLCSENGRCSTNGLCSCYYRYEGEACEDETECELFKDPTTPPLISLSVDTITDTVTIEVIVPFVPGQVFLIGFSPFDSRRNVTQPLRCENYNADVFDSIEDYEDYWDFPVDAEAPEALGTSRYPTQPSPNLDYWSIEAVDCGTVKWTGVFNVLDLEECFDFDGAQAIINQNGRIAGSICVNRIAPVDETDPEAGFICEPTELEFDEPFDDEDEENDN